MALLFQYGSNASSEHLNSRERLRGDATRIGAFETQDTYRFEFSVWSNKNKYAAANISPVQVRPFWTMAWIVSWVKRLIGSTPPESRRIWGVLYEVPDRLMCRSTAGDRPSMESIEGAKYHQVPIRLIDAQDVIRARPVVTYVVKNPKDGLSTSLHYVRHIVLGLRTAGAPEDYIDYVKRCAVRSNPDLDRGIAAL